MKSIKNFKNIAFLLSWLSVSSAFIDCSRTGSTGSNKDLLPVISTLFNHRMLLLLKGTYATDNPLSMSDYNNGNGNLYEDAQGTGLDLGFDTAGLPKAKDLPIFIDIGEVRISSKNKNNAIIDLSQIKDSKDSKKFWDFIAPNRQVYCNIPYAPSGTTCHKTGLLKMDDFFSGKGAEYPSNDPTAEQPKTDAEAAALAAQGYNIENGTWYPYSGIYFRSIVTGFSKELGAFKINTLFDNQEVSGINIVPRTSYPPGLGTAEKDVTVPKLFPLLYMMQKGQADMAIRPGNDPYILEIRANIKETLMVHSFVNSSNNVVTYVGFSDFTTDHKGESDQGGNTFSRARVIYPEYAASLEISGGTESKTHYYTIYRKDEEEFTKQLPLIASPVREGLTKIKYIHDGVYRLRCMGDTARVDGFPETLVRETFFSVPKSFTKQKVSVSLTCP